MNLKQHAFVSEYLYCNDAVLAYKNAYKSNSNYKTLESAANRLLKNPEVAQAIERSISSIRSRVENDIAKQLKVKLLSIQEKREILALIVRGEMYVEHHYKGKGCTQCSQYLKPSFNIILRAMQEDSRLAGHYPNSGTRLRGNSQKQTTEKHNKTQQISNHHLPLGEDGRGLTRSEHQKPGVNAENRVNEKTLRLSDFAVNNSRNKRSQNHNKIQQITPDKVEHKPLHTITHAGLRKLFAKSKTGEPMMQKD